MNSEISKHLNKTNLHHAYLIEGFSTEVVPEILSSLESNGVNVQNSPDVFKISVDVLKIDDAREISTRASLKGFSTGKKIFIISANNFLLEAQNTMLKLFEEPTEDTHFFIVMPNIKGLLPTFVSRFYLIKNKNEQISLEDADRFISMSLVNRINFIKELLIEDETKDESESSIESTRSKSLRFINSLELALHKRFVSKSSVEMKLFDQLFKVREYLRQPGSSTKSLMESVALVVPPTIPSL
jgi:hypothetical protein